MRVGDGELLDAPGDLVSDRPNLGQVVGSGRSHSKSQKLSFTIVK
jgi:hypothetical protein